MFFEITVHIHVSDIEEGQKWYETLLNRTPDFIPHESFVEWEIVPGCWLQVSEGNPGSISGPLRFAVKDILNEKERIIRELNIANFEIHSRPEVPVKWGTFTDPWGNQIGFYEYIDKNEEKKRLKTLAFE